MSLKLIDHFELSGNQTIVAIDSIPQDYTHLLIKTNFRVFRTGSYGFFHMQLNDDAGSVYTVTRLRWDSGGIRGQSFGPSATAGSPGYNPYNSNTSSYFGNNTFFFPNYTATGAKTFMAETTANDAMTIARVHSSQTPAITKIEFFDSNGSDFMTNSTFTVYGILRDADGSITVS